MINTKTASSKSNATPHPCPPSTESAIFHPFPKLALEIRRMIWKETFPPEQIVSLVIPKEYYQKRKDQQRPLPVALHVNQESRQVTLENYVILSHFTNERFPTFGCPSALPVCFDPARDRIATTLNTLFYKTELKDIAQKLLKKTPRLATKLRDITVEVDFHGLKFWAWHIWSLGTLDVQNGRYFMAGMLPYFTNLQYIQLYLGSDHKPTEQRKNSPSYTWESLEEMEGYRAQVQEYFEELKKHNPAYNIPEIICEMG
jgi:hypothetical protein